MNIVFMGTPQFAVPCLGKILEAGYPVSGVFTQPDKPKGRGYKMVPPPVKELALDGMRVETALGVLQKKYDAQEYHLRLPAGMACPYLVKEAPSGMAYWYDRQARERVLKEKGGAPYISLVLD